MEIRTSKFLESLPNNTGLHFLKKKNSAGYLHGTVMELNSGQPRINPVNSREEDLNLGLLDYNSSALTTGPHHLPPSEISVFKIL